MNSVSVNSVSDGTPEIVKTPPAKALVIPSGSPSTTKAVGEEIDAAVAPIIS